TQRALEAERAAMEAQKKTDSFLREIEEMKRLMQQVPIVKYQVMAYYQQVREEQKEVIHRQLANRDTMIKQPQPPPAAIYREPEVPAVVVPKEPEVPEVILPKEPEKPATVIRTEPKNPQPTNEEPETPPAVILKETETPSTLSKETGKPARAEVQRLFPKKRKKKRK
ncbi:MAG: hypothetical protein GY765_25030, partial [bacterium]|nr:hypothetical protein [bacterium]